MSLSYTGPNLLFCERNVLVIIKIKVHKTPLVVSPKNTEPLEVLTVIPSVVLFYTMFGLREKGGKGREIKSFLLFG